MNVCRFDKLPIIFTVLVLASGQVWADTWQQTATVRASTEYDSNPALSPNNPRSAWRFLFEPGYTLAGRFGESELKTGVALQIARSSNETLIHRRDSPSAFIDWLRNFNAGEFGITARYAEIATRDAGIDVTAQVPVDSIRSARTLSARWNKALSERSTLSVDGSYEKVNYSGGAYTDYATRSENMMFSYAWSERNTPFLKASHIDYEPAGISSPNTFSNTLFAGLNWILSDNLEGTLQVGKSKFSNENLVTQGAATMRYTAQQTGLILSADRLISPSGLGGFVIVDQANANWSYALSERSNTGIDLGWRKSQFVTDIINRTASVWLQRDLNSFWGLRTYYLNRIFEQDQFVAVSSNMLGLSLIYTYTDF